MSAFNMRKYWQAVREQRERIEEPFVFVTSIEDEVSGTKGGSVCQVSRDDAAILIVKKTHRLATKAEEIAYRAAEDELREVYKAAELQRRTLAVLTPAPTPTPKAKGEK